MADQSAQTVTIDGIADELYGLDVGQFVATRDQRATELRRDGETAAAKKVKALRRPTMAAWAVNQLVRRDSQMVDELLDVTHALDQAQREVLTGGSTDLRQLAERRQQLMDALLKRAERILEDAGRSASAHQVDLIRTLQATSNPDLARKLREGRLTSALEPESTLSGLTEWFQESGAASQSSQRQQKRELARAGKQAEDALAAAERELLVAEGEVDRLQGQLREAKRRVGRLARARDQRRSELDDTQRALGDADA